MFHWGNILQLIDVLYLCSIQFLLLRIEFCSSRSLIVIDSSLTRSTGFFLEYILQSMLSTYLFEMLPLG